MELPFFFYDGAIAADNTVQPAPETARHMIQVLRMKTGDRLWLTNGAGLRAMCSIQEVLKRDVLLQVLQVEKVSPPLRTVTLGVSLLHNTSRFEWLLEKATELGVSRILPLICARTEKQHFRRQRAESILISAMLQSKQSRLPEMPDPVKWKDFITTTQVENRFIAHCIDTEKSEALSNVKPEGDCIILIGPEGDFTPQEVKEAMQLNFKPVALGNTRLRSETSAIAALSVLML